VVWSREDDIKFDVYHSVAAMYMKAALGPDGKPTAWLQRTVFPPIGSTFDPKNNYSDPGELGLGLHGCPVRNWRIFARKNGPAQPTRGSVGSGRWPTFIMRSEFIPLQMNYHTQQLQ